MRIKIPITIIELEPDNYHIIISGEFADGKKVNWVIDTGASKTVFDKNLDDYYLLLDGESDQIHTAGIGDQPQEISLGLLHVFHAGKLKVEKLKVALLDLSHINSLYSKCSEIEICGLIGGDFLLKYKAVIDYKKKLLILNK